MSGIQPLFLIAYIIVPLVILLLFALLKPRRLPVSALICLVINFLLFGLQLLYPETRVLALSLIFVQAAAVLVLSLAIQRIVQEFFPHKM